MLLLNSGTCVLSCHSCPLLLTEGFNEDVIVIDIHVPFAGTTFYIRNVISLYFPILSYQRVDVKVYLPADLDMP